MWINPSFKYDVLKFVYDEMIKFRNLAGDAYPRMCAAVYAILPKGLFNQKVRDLANHLILLFMENMNQKCVIKLVMRLRYVSYTSWSSR